MDGHANPDVNALHSIYNCPSLKGIGLRVVDVALFRKAYPRVVFGCNLLDGWDGVPGGNNARATHAATDPLARSNDDAMKVRLNGGGSYHALVRFTATDAPYIIIPMYRAARSVRAAVMCTRTLASAFRTCRAIDMPREHLRAPTQMVCKAW